MSQVTDRAREMRQAMSPPEARLWVALKRLRGEGVHFRRQVPFRGYFLDFACHGSKLAIEVDGRSHDLRGEHDRMRDAVLAREGYRTLRFSNVAIRDDLGFVLAQIKAALTLPPLHGEGRRSAAKPGWGREDDRPSSQYPTLAAAPPVPPHEGEGQ